jgi:uncharacterized protein YbjT (DUF2867 family)
MATKRGTMLIIGGTGKTGRRVAKRLSAHDVPIRVGTDFTSYVQATASTGVWNP